MVKLVVSSNDERFSLRYGHMTGHIEHVFGCWLHQDEHKHTEYRLLNTGSTHDCTHTRTAKHDTPRNSRTQPIIGTSHAKI